MIVCMLLIGSSQQSSGDLSLLFHKHHSPAVRSDDRHSDLSPSISGSIPNSW